LSGEGDVLASVARIKKNMPAVASRFSSSDRKEAEEVVSDNFPDVRF